MPGMAIAFARARYLSRSTGGSAVRSAAYNARETIAEERTGALYSFKHRDAPEHHEVLLPEGADAKFGDAAALWNAAELAERRRDAQVARELVIALPADREVTPEDRLELVRSFAERHFVSRGLAVQLDVHAPHEGEGESERANYHAHLLVTTRRVEGDRLSAKKARDLDPEVRSFAGRAAVTEGEQWGAAWRDHQNAYFAAHGMALRVDAAAAVAGQHVGPIRMRAADSAAVAKAEELARENALAARDPEKVLGVLTRNTATFTEADLDRHLAKHLRDADEHAAVRTRVLDHGDVLPLFDAGTGERAGRYTTVAVREGERAALADAEHVAASRRHRALGEGAKTGALASRSLREDQRAAFDHATAAGGLRIVEGRAGTGKSYTLAAVREAHERAGYAAIGLAPTNSVAQDLKADGFKEAATVHSELFRLKNGRTRWDSRTLVVVDEAAMLDSRVTGELLAEAKRSGAKLVLAGDDRQLASIERGGLFTELRQRHGSAEITEVTRQRSDWQRGAARDMAEGRVAAAVEAFAAHGAITWTKRQDEARAALVEHWRADTAERPDASRFVFAYTNRDVDRLNAELRVVRRERGELGDDVRLDTKHGPADFAVGDRVQFTDTLKAAKIYNGNAGTVTAVDADTGTVRARLDAVGSEGREVIWRADEFAGFRHGYAGTIYKGQGKTLDHTYLLHSHHWRQASSYVALTRQRETAQIFAATETARDPRELAWQMGRVEVRSASVAWATADEVLTTQATTPRQRERYGEGTETGVVGGEHETVQAGARSTVTWPSPAAASVNAAVPLQKPDEDERDWLIPPRVSLDGRDSLGRGLDPGSIAAAVAGNRAVQHEREALHGYLKGSYRDPHEAHARLSELMKSDGAVSTGRRLSADPGQLGELRGKTGWLAGREGRDERSRAERVSEAVGPAVSRIGEAERRAAQGYRGSVEARLAAEATGVPWLSERAQAELAAVAKAEDDKAKAKAWTAVQKDEAVSREIANFRAAAAKRFGEEGIRAMLRSEWSKAKPYEGDASVPKEHKGAVAEVARAAAAAKSGEMAASASQKQSERLAQRAHQGPRLQS